ncbi:cadherin-like protein 26 isoform X2 [Kryptolebias marmoratus]|uniref:Cadherin-like protein 26 n=1 Tax=Kryptolebias marmoratus TaxID=37003 RepID=A0A3Q3FZQ4_KRYMA|nr:cadherin-like protein 26 isoform X2 [Kryptolebias marmoratus]
MRSIFLLLLVAVAALGKSRDERDLLLRSKRRWVLSTIDLEEEMDVKYPFKISTMHNDKTEGEEYKFVISGDGVDEQLFTIGAQSGDVFVHRRIDRETKANYHIRFDVVNVKTGQGLDKELAFDVDIKDINDNAPQFTRMKNIASVKENEKEGYLDAFVEAKDADQENTPNSTVVITVEKQTPAEPVIEVHQIDDRLARLRFKGCFDYSEANQYEITVTARDKGKPPLSTSTVIKLSVIDTNSHRPTFKKKKYQAEVLEMMKHNDILRIEVEDKDTPDTDGWRAKYSIISGNEEGIFEIKTDPKTNEGILSVVKEINFKEDTLVNLQIAVENIEPLTICKDNKLITEAKALPLQESINITVKVNDTNDAPVFEKYTDDVYQTEERDPGEVLYKPNVHDIDSPEIRFVLVHDPAKWVSVDEKTGEITTVQRMDRESPHVDENNIYRIVIEAIDNGIPPATSTCTVKIHLRDINDNTPKLINKTKIMCGNKVDKIMLPVKDADGDPFSGPFNFYLKNDETLRKQWKIEPAYGYECGLVSRSTLAYGNYSVTLVIEDKQNLMGEETLVVVMCDCGKGDICRDKIPLSAGFSDAGIGLIFAALLLFLLLLIVFGCWRGKKTLKYIDTDEGNQTLIKYNDEGGGTACMTEPVPLSPTSSVNVTDGLKQGYMQKTEAVPEMMQSVNIYNSVSNTYSSNMYASLRQPRESRRSYEGPSRSLSWNTSRRQTLQSNSMHRQTLRALSSQVLECHISQKVPTLSECDPSSLDYMPTYYANEGNGSICQSLDQLSLNNQEEDLNFLDNLGPRFKTLGEICQQSKNVQL